MHNAMMFNVTTDEKDNLQDIIKKCDKYVVGKTKKFLERFNRRDQESAFLPSKISKSRVDYVIVC